MGLFDFMLSPARRCERDILKKVEKFAKETKSAISAMPFTGQDEDLYMHGVIITALDSAIKTLMENRASQELFSIPDDVYEKIVSTTSCKVYKEHFPKWGNLIEVHSNKDIEEAVRNINKSIVDFRRPASYVRKRENSLRQIIEDIYPNQEEFERNCSKDLDKVILILQETDHPLQIIKKNGSRELSQEWQSKVALLAMNEIVGVINRYTNFIEQPYGLGYNPVAVVNTLIFDESWRALNMIYNMGLTGDLWQHYTETREKLYRMCQFHSAMRSYKNFYN